MSEPTQGAAPTGVNLSSLPPVTTYTVIDPHTGEQRVINATVTQSAQPVQQQQQQPMQATGAPVPAAHPPVTNENAAAANEHPQPAAQPVVSQPTPAAAAATTTTTTTQVATDPHHATVVTSPPPDHQANHVPHHVSDGQVAAAHMKDPSIGRPRSSSNASTVDTSLTSGPDGADHCADGKEKRIKDFKKHFDTEADEQLVCTHGCALVIQIMVHGRIYMTNKNLYFRSNIIGIVTKRQIPIKSIISIAPKNVAGSIPNAIEIVYDASVPVKEKNMAKFTPSEPGPEKALFTTFNDRDHVMGNLVSQWKVAAPEAYEKLIQQGHGAAITHAKTAGSGGGHHHRTSSAASASSTSTQKPTPAATTDKSTPDQDHKPTDGDGPHPATKADVPDLEKRALDVRLSADNPQKVFDLLYHSEHFMKGLWEEEGMQSECLALLIMTVVSSSLTHSVTSRH